jgi:acetyl-CoA carboxylase biotin carboxyl carrier protein
VDILKENDLVEIEISTLLRKVRISRGVAAGPSATVAPAQLLSQPASVPDAGEAAPVAGEEAGFAEITSPMVGTFYRAPAPGADNYVEEGQRIEKGTPICIIEAMKIMNEIESEYGGTIHKIKVSNAEPVEYGQVLMTIKSG